jgi:hypothetical protein
MPPNEYTSTVPATKGYEITPSDSTDLSPHARVLFIGTGGDLKITTKGDTTITFPVLTGQYVLFQVKRVWATGTTATDIVSMV